MERHLDVLNIVFFLSMMLVKLLSQNLQFETFRLIFGQTQKLRHFKLDYSI